MDSVTSAVLKRIAVVLIVYACLFSLLIVFDISHHGRKEPQVVVIDRSKLNQIKLGISQREVEDILGIKPGDYTSGSCSICNPPLLFISKDDEFIPESSYVRWMDDSTMLVVAFDENGELIRAFACTHQLK